MAGTKVQAPKAIELCEHPFTAVSVETTDANRGVTAQVRFCCGQCGKAWPMAGGIGMFCASLQRTVLDLQQRLQRLEHAAS